jgi:hypothetical protein
MRIEKKCTWRSRVHEKEAKAAATFGRRRFFVSNVCSMNIPWYVHTEEKIEQKGAVLPFDKTAPKPL